MFPHQTRNKPHWARSPRMAFAWSCMRGILKLSQSSLKLQEPSRMIQTIM